MATVTAAAPVAFSATTSVTGTATQLFQVSSAGVTAGLTAGNFYLDSPPSNLLNGKKFVVTAGGFVKAHGATQKIAFGLQCFPWNTSVAGARTASGTETMTAQPGPTLTAGTFYDFYIQQTFFADSNANTLTCGTPLVFVAGAAPGTAPTPNSTPIVVAAASASQTEPITGVNNSTNYPLCSFAVEFYNAVSDTTETLQLTTFNIDVALG